MNQLAYLTVHGSLAFAIVAALERCFATRTRARERRGWWLLVPLAFLLTVPLAVLPHPIAAPLSQAWEQWVPTARLEATARSLASRFETAGAPRKTTHVSPFFILAAGGAAAYLLTALLRTRAALRRWNSERLSTDTALLAVLEDCKADAGITAPIGLVVSGAVDVPVLSGWLRPRILLPAGLANTLSRTQLRHVLLHELAHFRSWDVPMNWLFTLVCALHWFNPAAHLAFRAWTLFREEAADEAAIVWSGQVSGQAYGETLLRVLRNTTGRPAPFAALAIVESISQLRKRIIMIKQYESKSPRYLLTGAILAVVALGIFLRPVRAGEASEDPRAIATGTMQDWLKEIDDGKFEQSWQEASPAFQEAIPMETWVGKLKQVRTPLGQCNERKLGSASHQSNLPSPKGAQTGEFILAQYDSSFEGLKYAVETVTFVKAADGTWKVAGYYIKPKA